MNKKNALRVGFSSPGASYSPLAVVTTDGPEEGGRLWHLVRVTSFLTLLIISLVYFFIGKLQKWISYGSDNICHCCFCNNLISTVRYCLTVYCEHFQVKQLDYPTDRAEDDRNSKFLSEIYLTRLLKTKVGFECKNLQNSTMYCSGKRVSKKPHTVI